MFPSLITANLLIALLVWIATPTAINAKRAQAHALYEDLKGNGVLIERAEYDIEAKLRIIAGDNQQMISGFHLASAICIGNAFALFLASRKLKITQPIRQTEQQT